MKISTLTKMAVTGTFLALGSYFSTASAEVIDLGNLEPGVEYSWQRYNTVKGEYTPSVTGPVKFIYKTSPLVLYTTPEHTEGTEVFGTHSYSDTGQIRDYAELTAGTTYYLYHSFAPDDNTLIIHEGSQELKVTSTSPSTDPESKDYYGGKLSVSNNFYVDVNFNYPITVGNVFVVAPDNTRESVSTMVKVSQAECDIAPAMMLLYKAGKIKEGDEVTLRLLQVTDASDKNNKYNGNGRCEINFTVAAKPLELVEVIGADRSSTENIFNSYYLPGDEKSLIKLVFDGPLSTEKNAVASIEYGDSDNLEVGLYHENINASHNGNTATFDMSGKLRRPIDMLPASDSSTQPEALYMAFGNIFSPDGQRAYTGVRSNPTSFGMSFLVNVLQYTVACDFTPMRGTDLIFGQPMEIWVMNGNKMVYDTIRFEYTENGEDKYYDIPEENVTEEPDPYSEDAMIYTFNIPTLNCDPDTPVKVRMTGIECADGLDHSNDVYGEFKQATSGINDVDFAESDIFDVYDITGVRVLTGARSNDLSSLAKGIYVINGKKIVK